MLQPRILLDLAGKGPVYEYGPYHQEDHCNRDCDVEDRLCTYQCMCTTDIT